MLVRNVWTVSGLLALLEQPTWEMQTLRTRVIEQGRFPSRRTWERRLATLPSTLLARIGCLGRHLVEVINPWAGTGRAVALDSTILHARGGVWHNKHRDAGVVPRTSIDTEAGWTKSGWHGWVYGYKLHLATTVAAVWIPLAAELTPANTADNEPATRLLDEVPPAARFILGDTHYNDPAVRAHCTATGRLLVATRRGPYPNRDDGVEVCRVLVVTTASLARHALKTPLQVGDRLRLGTWYHQMQLPRASATDY